MDLEKNIAGMQLSIFDIKTTCNTLENRNLKKTNAALIKCKPKNEIFTLDQQRVYKEFLKKDKVLRVIHYCDGNLAIEVKEDTKIITYCIDKCGKNEFKFEGRSRALPMDKIVYYCDTGEVNEVQKLKLNEILGQGNDIKRVIKRKGDFNLFIEKTGIIISIISKGWALEFKNVSVVFKDDEVLSEEDIKKLLPIK